MTTAKIQTEKVKNDSSIEGLDRRNGVMRRLLYLIRYGILFSVQTGQQMLSFSFKMVDYLK